MGEEFCFFREKSCFPLHAALDKRFHGLDPSIFLLHLTNQMETLQRVTTPLNKVGGRHRLMPVVQEMYGSHHPVMIGTIDLSRNERQCVANGCRGNYQPLFDARSTLAWSCGRSRRLVEQRVLDANQCPSDHSPRRHLHVARALFSNENDAWN